MSKPTIAIDMDDVLTASTAGVRRFINRHYGTAHTAEDYSIVSAYSGYWGKVWGGSDEENRRWYEHYVSSGEQVHLEPVEGALDAIAKLQKYFELMIVTAREANQIAHTEAWLEVHAPQLLGKLEFLHAHPSGRKATKAMILEEAGASYLIDDKVENCMEVARAGLGAVLFGDYGWHKVYATIPDSIIRCKDWTAVLEYFDGIGRP